MTTSYRSLTLLSVSVFALLAYNFLGAAWTPAPANPPNENVAAPINVGTDTQVKNGRLNLRSGADMAVATNTVMFRTNGNALANIFAAGSQMRSPEYCDERGNNCFAASQVGEVELPGENEVGSIILAVIGPSAPMADTYNQNVADRSVLKYGDTILGRHLCPAGILMADTNDNDKISMIQSAGNGTSATTCGVTLTGVWRALGYAYHRSSTLSSNQNRTAATLFQKISDTIPPATYSWTVSSWGYCSVYAYCDGRAGSQTRSVKCRNNNTGSIVADSYCPAPKPEVTQTCFARTQCGGGH